MGKNKLSDYLKTGKFFDLSLDCLCIAGTDGFFKKVNPSFTRILGWSCKQLLSRPFLELIHKEDIPKTLLEMDRLKSNIPTISFDNRYRCLDGTYRTFQWTAHPDKATGLLFAIARDVTELRHAEEMFRLAVDASPSAMVRVDDAERILMVNRETERLFGYDRSQLIGRKLHMLLPNRIRRKHSELHRSFMRKASKRRMGIGMRLEGRHCDGHLMPLEIGLNPIRVEDATFVICGISDLTAIQEAERKILEQKKALEVANEQLEVLATTDKLTGLNNRRAFFEKYGLIARIQLRSGRPFSLIMIDVDHFKDYNDSFGHQAGDALLKTLGSLILKNTRSSDIAARLGGEEFVLLLPDTDRGSALLMVEKLRRAVASQTFPHRKVTASFGVSTTSLSKKKKISIPALMARTVKQADQALYTSKETGRNRVTHFDEGQ